jgi:hypothetical protein
MAIADRLIELLPQRSRSKMQSTEMTHGLQQMTSFPVVLICATLGLAVLIIAAIYGRWTRSDDADASAYSRAARRKLQYRDRAKDDQLGA